MTVHEYILEHWKDTIRIPGKDDVNSFIKMPNRYTTPCASSGFTNFYYWDTYFTNLGLIEDGLIDVALDNVRVFKFFVDKFGYIPNADSIIENTQPPFFTRAVYDIYVKTKNKELINEFKDAIKRELLFWENDRMTPIGLNQYKGHESVTKRLNSYNYWISRVGEFSESEKQIDKALLSHHFFAIGESGWDCTIRYETLNNRFAALDFVNIDLNCLLYDAEVKYALMLKIVGDYDLAKTYEEKALNRKKLINKYMFDKETKLYYDYNFVQNKLSKHLSAVSFMPYVVGVADDLSGLKEIYNRLVFEHGVSCGEYRGDTTYFQWDYPNMWPSNVYFAYLALKQNNLFNEANDVKNKYINTVDNVFNESGHLWEKYNSLTGKVSVSIEYETPPMMGWTAGVYEYLKNN